MVWWIHLINLCIHLSYLIDLDRISCRSMQGQIDDALKELNSLIKIMDGSTSDSSMQLLHLYELRSQINSTLSIKGASDTVRDYRNIIEILQRVIPPFIRQDLNENSAVTGSYYSLWIMIKTTGGMIILHGYGANCGDLYHGIGSYISQLLPHIHMVFLQGSSQVCMYYYYF